MKGLIKCVCKKTTINLHDIIKYFREICTWLFKTRGSISIRKQMAETHGTSMTLMANQITWISLFHNKYR